MVPFHFLCLSCLSIYTLSLPVHNYSLFLSFHEQHWLKRWAASPSIHPLLIHSLVIQLLFFSLSLYVLNLWTEWSLGNSLSSLYYNCWIRDLHWTSSSSMFSPCGLSGLLGTFSVFSFLQLLDWRLTSWGLFHYRDCLILFFYLSFFFIFCMDMYSFLKKDFH